MTRDLKYKKFQRPLLGFNLAFPSPDLVEFMGILGFDYVFVDGEHYAFNIETIQSIVRAAELTNMIPIARVLRNDPETILIYLETGIQGILVPHIKTTKDAQAVVDAVKYFPMGKRGAGGRSRVAKYGIQYTAQDYYELANEKTMVILMIEEAEAIQNLPEILSVPGVDYVDFGPNDLALSMGFIDKKDLAKVNDLIETAKQVVIKSNKGYCAAVQTVEDGLKAKQEGASLIEFNTNTFLQREAKKFLEKLRHE